MTTTATDLPPDTLDTFRFAVDRVRAGADFEPWPKHVEAVREAWKLERYRADAERVIDRFPALFPLLGKRGAN
jgi:hypothetical protein